MKELLIKIKALFEGSGAQQAKQAISDVDAAADKAAGSAGKLGEGMGNVDAKAAGFTGVMAGASAAVTTFAIDLAQKAVTALIDFAKGLAQGVLEIANFAGSMTDLASRTGQTVSDVTILQQAFKNAGMSADSVGPTINKLQKAIQDAGGGTGPAAEAFARLKINLDEFRQLTAVEQLNVLAQRIGSLPDPASRAGTAMDIMGRSAGQMLTMFSDSQSIETAKTQIGSLAGNLEKSGAALDAFSDSMAAMDTKKMQFFAGMAAQFADELEAAGVAVDQLDLGPLGEQFGIVIRGVIEVGKEIGAWVGWVKEFTDALGVTGPLIDGIKQGIMNALGPAGQLLQYFYDTGKAAVETDEAQAQVTAEIEASRASAQALIDRMNENKAVALGTIDAINQAGTEGVEGTAEAATANITQGGDEAQTGIQTATETGKQEIQLTAQQIQEAANQLASAFQTGMGQDISPALQALVTSVQTSYQSIGEQIQNTATQLQTALDPTLIQTPLQTLTESLTAFTTMMQTNMEQLTTAVTTMQTSLEPQITQLQTSITAALPTITQSVTTLNTTVTSANLPQMGQTLQTIGTNFQTFGQSFQTGIQQLQQSSQQMGQQVTQGFQQAAQGQQQVAQSVQQGVQSMSQAVSQGVTQIGQAVSTGLSGIGQAISGAVAAIWNAINQLRQVVAALAARG